MDIAIHGVSRRWVAAGLLGIVVGLATLTTLVTEGVSLREPVRSSALILASAPVVGAASIQTGSVAAEDHEFFTRLASFLTCSHDWLDILAGLLGYGDTPLSRVVTVADTCHPGSGLYAIGRWIGGS